MKARQIIEAEDPKAFLQQHAPRLMYYRFSLAEGAFCFSIVARDENEAIQRALLLLNSIGPSWKLTDDEYIDLTVYTPDEVNITAENITTIDEVSDVFNIDPAEAVANWEAKFKEITGGQGA